MNKVKESSPDFQKPEERTDLITGTHLVTANHKQRWACGVENAWVEFVSIAA